MYLIEKLLIRAKFWRYIFRLQNLKGEPMNILLVHAALCMSLTAKKPLLMPKNAAWSYGFQYGVADDCSGTYFLPAFKSNVAWIRSTLLLFFL